MEEATTNNNNNTLSRQQRRSEIRYIAKELAKIKKAKAYATMCSYFDTLAPEDYDILKTGKHEDQTRQKQFNHYFEGLKVVLKLEARENLLRESFIVRVHE